MGPRQFIADQLLAKAGVTRAMHERVQLFQDPQTEFALLRTALALAPSTTSPWCMATQSCKRNELLISTMRLGRGPFERLFQGFAEECSEQATHDAGQSRRIQKSARHCGSSFGTHIAATPRILAMIQDAVMAHLAAIIETATTIHLEALDGEDQATAKLSIQKAAWAADEAWQKTVEGHNRPVVTNPPVSELEHPSSASQDDDDEDMGFLLGPSEEPTQCTVVPSAAFTVL